MYFTSLLLTMDNARRWKHLQNEGEADTKAQLSQVTPMRRIFLSSNTTLCLTLLLLSP